MERSVHRGAGRGHPTRIRVVAAVLRDGAERVLLGLRPPGGPHGGLWEFPGGKVEPGETPEAALVRELHEELGVRVRVGGPVLTVDHEYPHLCLTLTAYECRLVEGIPQALEHRQLVWVAPGELGGYPMPEADGPIRERVAAGR